MNVILVGVVGVLTVVAVTALAPRVRMAAPLLLVVLGICVSFLPIVGPIEVEPEWILAGILPPLLYSSAVSLPAMEFRRDFRIISVFSVVLVAASAVAVGLLVNWLLPGVDLATGIALGAVLSPTDAVATSIIRRVGVSPRLVTVLEGESLLNDASALVLLRSAIVAMSLTVSLWSVIANFVYAVLVALVIGWAVGRLNLLVRARLSQPSASVAVSFVVPFVAYLPAEELRASGLVAAVVAGLVTGHGAPTYLRAEDRLTEGAVWRTVELLLESSIFLIMGLELFGLVEDVRAEHESLLIAVWLAGVATLVVLGARTAFVAGSLWSLARRNRRGEAIRARIAGMQQRADARGGVPAPRRPGADSAETERRMRARTRRFDQQVARTIADLDYLAAEAFGWREGVVLVWAGMRGAVTLAAGQSLPSNTPQRSLLVLIAFVVAAGTLIVQGGTLPWLARSLGLTRREAIPTDAWLAMHADLLQAAATRLDDPRLIRSDGQPYSERAIAAARGRMPPQTDDEEPDDQSAAGERRREFRELRLELIAAERSELLRLRDLGAYSSGILDRALNQLDADQLSVQLRQPS